MRVAGDSPDATDSLSSGFDRLSSVERDEVQAQIDRVVIVDRPDAAQFTYEPKHHGSVFLLVVNAIAVAMIVVAALVLTDLFAVAPGARLVAGSAPMTAEATVLDRFRREAAIQLDAQELEIERIRAELTAATNANTDLDAEGRAEAERRARGLESALGAAIAAGTALRAQIATAGDLGREELESRLVALRDQASGTEAEFERLRAARDREARLAEQLSELYRSAGEALTDGRTDAARVSLRGVETLLASPLAVSLSLTDRRAGVDALLTTTLREYAAVLELPAVAVADGASDVEIAQLRAEAAQLRAEAAQLRAEAAQRAAEAAQRAAEVDAAAFALTAREQDVERLEADLAVARAALREADVTLAGRSTTATTQTAEVTRLRGRVTTLEADLSATRATVATQQSELTTLNRELATSQRTIADRDATIRQAAESAAAAAADRARRAELLVPVRRAVDGSVSAVARDRAELFASLQLKVRVLEALRQDAVLSSYPGIEGDLETYLDALGQEQRMLGRSETLGDIARMLGDLPAGRVPDHAALAARYRIDAAVSLRSLLDALDPLLR